jgi:catechol 2,3-dioxygenase-like lactoylglutathione lyase family enzyme
MTDIASPVPRPAAGAKAPGVSRAIYGMPMFATLLARDIGATVSWYTSGLGFISLFEIPGPEGGPVLVHLRRWQFQDLLVRPAGGPVSPGSGCTLSFAAVYGEIDALAERARAHGGGQVDGPADTPWNTRDLATVDPDGNRVILTAARPQELADADFSRQMQQWSSEQGCHPRSRSPREMRVIREDLPARSGPGFMRPAW